jgi:hypothetical protein
MDTRILSIIGLLLVIFIAAMLANNGVVGYSSAKSLKEYPYEGFSEIKEKFEARQDETQHSPAEAFGPYKKNEYASAEAFNVSEMVKSLNPFKKEAFGSMSSPTSLESTPQDETPAIKVAGFNGLQSGAYGDEKIIGFMYNNDSNTTCKPFGYTNSKGNICLSEGDIKLLTTRGGNALGASDQIGK